MQPRIGKWRFRFGLHADRFDSGAYWFEFGIFKMIKIPEHGVYANKDNYVGFWFSKEIDLDGFLFDWGRK